jgi:23S rRNA pseudouridine1911/1915/1917 synthase
MEILFENSQLIVAVKPPSLLSEQTPNGDGFADLLAAQNGGYIGVIHRLDRGVGGVMVYAKTRSCAARLSSLAQEHKLGKEYLAVTEGCPDENEGSLEDLLYYDRSKNKVFVVKKERRGVKRALLSYRVLQSVTDPHSGKTISLISVTPHTGRTHQIRVQFASRGYPLLGDRRYGGSAAEGISLFCHAIELPVTEKQAAQRIERTPTGYPWDLFGL